jgi:predicted metal-binding protein
MENPERRLSITVCSSCPAGQAGLAATISAALVQHNLSARVVETECMSGCARPSSVAFRQPGKTAYLFGDVSHADLGELLTFTALYLASPDGTFPDARPLGDLRFKALARIPG